MCTILGVVFVKNGSQSIPGCTATTADKIDIDMIVNLTSSEINRYISGYASWTVNGVSKSAYVKPIYVSSDGIYVLIVPVKAINVGETGTYAISSNYGAMVVLDNTNATSICTTSLSQSCNSLTVTQACTTPTCNFVVA